MSTWTNIKQEGLKAKQTESHGSEFQQIWLGIWQKYASEPSFTAASRPTKPKLDAAIQRLMRAVDSAFSSIGQRLRRVDELIYNRCRPLHRHIHHRAVGAGSSTAGGKSDRAKAAGAKMKTYLGKNLKRK